MAPYCCRGYCMDLLRQLAEYCNFTFDLYLSLDAEYGVLDRNTRSGKMEWTGLIGECRQSQHDDGSKALFMNLD